jgi:hypothetical protein
MTKSHRLSFNVNTISISTPLEIMHSDLWDPSPIMSKDELYYYVIFVDDFTCFTWIYILKSKDELVQIFLKNFKYQVENVLGTTIINGVTKYKPITNIFSQLIHQITCPSTP